MPNKRDSLSLNQSIVGHLTREIGKAIATSNEVAVAHRSCSGEESADFDHCTIANAESLWIDEIDHSVGKHCSIDAGQFGTRHAIQYARAGSRLNELHDLSGLNREAVVFDDRAITRANNETIAILREGNVPASHSHALRSTCVSQACDHQQACTSECCDIQRCTQPRQTEGRRDEVRICVLHGVFFLLNENQ